MELETTKDEVVSPETPKPEEKKQPEKKAEGKRAISRGLLVFLCAVLVGAILGFGIMSIILGANNRRAKEFTVSDMTITLNDGFTRQNYPGTLAAFGSKNVAVFIRNVDVTAQNSLYTEKTYAELIIAESGDTAELRDDDGLCYFTLPFVNQGGVRLVHYIYVIKTDSDFWVVQFDVRESKEKRLAPHISEWAHSIRFE